MIGIDLGGTKILGAVVSGASSSMPAVLSEEKRSTPIGSVDDVIDEVVSVARSLHDAPAAVGVGTPGVVAPGAGVLQVAPNLPGFDRPVPLGAILEERLGVPVFVANDVNMAALGEARAGGAAGHADVLAIWLGTGLGAGLVLDGHLRVGPTGLAGELGHVVVVPDGRECGCGGRGHLEAYIGRHALEAEARAAHAAGRYTALVELAAGRRMKSKVFRAAYDQADELTVKLIERGLSLLGVAVANVVVTVDVGAIVIGGGLGKRFADVAVRSLSESLTALHFAGEVPVVLEASLGDHSATVGAAALADELWRSGR